MQELPKRLAIPSMRTLIGLASLLTESRSAPRRNRMRLIHSDKVEARRELLRHGYWPIGVGPRRVRLVEITA